MPEKEQKEQKDHIEFRNLNKQQKNRIYKMIGTYTLVFILVLTYFCAVLVSENNDNEKNWSAELTMDSETQQMADELSVDAQKVTVGTYVDNLRNIDIKNSEYRVNLLIWFDWEGDPDLDPASHFRIYKGAVNDKFIMEEIHDGKTNYQLVSINVTISKNYHTKRFPLESHQFRFYVESTRPIQEVVFQADEKNSGFNEHLTITGFKFIRSGIGNTAYNYDSTHGDPRLVDTEMSSEVVSAFEIKRVDFGLYFKCFVALYATLIWVMISLYICTYHHVDPLGMLPGALFGAVGNIVIGTNLLPEATSTGLLEYGNIWGALMILAATFAIISINRVRKLKDAEYSQLYGRFLFYLICGFMILGEVLLPVLSYWS